MNVLYRMTGLSPRLMVWAEDDVVRADGGAAVLSEQAGIVPGLGGQVFRLVNADVTLTGAADFSGDRAFSVLVWFRGGRRTTTRRLFGRVNGGTSVVLNVSAQGVPQVTVSSTAGGHRASITGPARVDDGTWHLIGLTAHRRTTFGGLVDTGGVNLDLWVDDGYKRASYIDPGVFGTSPQLAMTAPVFLGRSESGSMPVDAEVGPLGVYGSTLSDSAIRSVWTARPEDRRGFTGWGIGIG